MREYRIELGGKERRLVANFAAAQKLSERVADPLFIGQQAKLEYEMISAGIPYTPKFEFTISNVPEIILIGLEESDGPTPSLKEIQEWVFERGFFPVKEEILNYLALILGPGPTQDEEDSADSGEARTGN